MDTQTKQAQIKPTAGPWSVGEMYGGDRIAIVHHDNSPGAISGNLAFVIARSSWRSEAEANARLIAAVPELLELAREYVALLHEDGCPESTDKCAKVRALLARIEGAQS